jgi:hypothetical protein
MTRPMARKLTRQEAERLALSQAPFQPQDDDHPTRGESIALGVLFVLGLILALAVVVALGDRVIVPA